MKEIGIVVCNYNKASYVVKCVESILNSSFRHIDVLVVDNASTDNSVNELYRFQNRIEIIQNKENLGGSGGFNTGLRRLLQKQYKYIMLIDNDVILEKEAIKQLYNFMEQEKEVGLAGAKIMKMDYIEYLQEMGAMIDYDNLGVKPFFAGEKDKEDIPDVIYCDYVPACTLIARVEAIKKVGILPENNFIYWDDMEWGYNFNQAGYKVVSYAKSKVWHKGGVTVSNNTFQVYYWYRNKIKFFLKHHANMTNQEIKDKILDEIFRAIYACFYSGRYNKSKTLMNAFLDALNNVGGKAENYKIRPIDIVEDRFVRAIDGTSKILLEVDEQWDNLRKIIQKISNLQKKYECIVISHYKSVLKNSLQKKYPQCKFLEYNEVIEYDKYFKVCEHIFSVKDNKFKKNYVDGWGNVILNQKELIQCNNYKENLELFKISYEDIIEEVIIKNTKR